ncbi:MAG: glycine--tRNA ligase subunit beta [Endomicrobium sp.]|jgi:glycyl-tRNA synthetase beta chain|nr:glycine--tRNA ligase subunit beta [Endomicrobium sp.]
MLIELKDAILEIRSEELPVSYIESAIEQIGLLSKKLLSEYKIHYDSLNTYATSRRLILLVNNINTTEKYFFKEIIGPNIQMMRNANGEYTELAKKFAVKNNINLNKINNNYVNKNGRYSLNIKVRYEKIEILLSKIFLKILKNIHFPKSMIWNSSKFKFARPIRNILAIYGRKKIKFQIANLNTTNHTTGLHSYNSKKIKINSATDYINKMNNNFVIINQYIRLMKIKEGILNAVKNLGCVEEDVNLLKELNYLVEYPSVILCTFNKKYLVLPRVVVKTCIIKNQKCFLVNDKSNKLLNYFICIKNGISNNNLIIKNGYEQAVEARLSDALFFYNKDIKNKIIINFTGLKNVIFHKDMGSVYDKLMRIKTIAKFLNDKLNVKINNALLYKAIMLSKTDLLSKMVFEYPILQGKIGKIYALQHGESLDIANAIEQHYLPNKYLDKLPDNKLAILISLADKLDTIITNFFIGLEPNGSSDPYGLRRICIGIIRMINTFFSDIRIDYIFKKVIVFSKRNLNNNLEIKNIYNKLIDFFINRIVNIYENKGYCKKEIMAVLSCSKTFFSFEVFNLKIKLFKDEENKKNIIYILSTFKRLNKIIIQTSFNHENYYIDSSLFVNNVETILYFSALKIKKNVLYYMQKKEYSKVIKEMLTLKIPIDEFFKKVKVISLDNKIMKNRIALLNFIKSIYMNFLNFSIL